MELLDNEKIEKEKRDTFELYQGKFNRYIADSKNEVSTVKGYQGRELLELIQNAEDECKDRNGILKISLKGNILRIENSGNPFTYKGILSLMTAKYSQKDSQNFIGNKGLGFRSVLSWSNSVSIFSSLLSVRFSRADADKMQSELVKAVAVEKLEEYRFDDYKIPIFSAPNTDIEYINPSDGMDTLILLECKDEAISKIKEQLNLINGKELLFLKNLWKIIIEQEDTRIFAIVDEPFEKTESNNIFCKKCLIETHEKDKVYEYKVYQSTDSLPYKNEDNVEKQKRYIMSLAIPVGEASSDENLYSFFRTNIKSPFRFILNATFELDDNRKYISDDDDFNKKVISFLPKFIIESVIHNYSDKNNVSYDLLKELLIEDLNFLSNNGYNFKDTYIKILKDSKVFPTVNNEFIDYNAKPTLYKMPFAKILKGEQFNNLLQFTEDEKIIAFCITTLEHYHYPQESMSTKINAISKIFSVSERAYLIKLFVDYYRNLRNKTSHFPNLLLDSKDEEIKANEVKVFNQPKEEELDSMPQFVQLRFISRSLFEELGKLIDFSTNHKVRETIDKYLKHFGVAEYSFSSLASIINSTSESDLSYSQVLDLLKWVYKVYKTQKKEDLNSIKLKLKLPINKTDFEFANKLYFSDKYDNRFYAPLLKKASKEVKFVADKEKIGFGNEKTKDLIEFFDWLGVAKRPRKIKHTLNSKELNEYKQFHSLNDYTSGQVWVYEYFFEMLEKLSTTEILKWLLDEQGTPNSIMSSKNELSDSYLRRPTYRGRSYTDTRDIMSFVRWQLGIKFWIDIKNNETQQRKTLSDCLLDNSIDVSPFLFNPKIQYNELRKYNSEYTETKVNSLLEELGVTIKLADLSFERFYNLLFQLKDIDKEMRITRKVYKILFEKVKANSGIIDEIIKSNSYSNFVENGYVLAQIGKDKEFALVGETFYSDKKDLCNGILKTMNILDMERRLGQEKISKIFGVQTLAQTKVNIQNSVPHLLNGQFQELLKDIKPFLVVYRQDKIKKELELIRNIDITLCSSVDIAYTINEDSKKEYCLLHYENIYSRDSKKAYICVPNGEDNLNELKSNYSFRESLAELLTVIIDVSEGKDTYENLIRDDLAISQRRVEDSFGNRGLALLEQAKKDLGETQSSEDAFWSIIKKIVEKNIDKVKAEFSFKLSYDKINSKENYEHIIDLFKKLSISVQLFNANSDGRFVINLKGHWNEQFAILKNSLANKYQAYQFDLIGKSKASDKYKLYVNAVREYNFKQIESDCNIVSFSIDKEFENLYGVSVQAVDKIEEINIEEIKAQNIEKYKAEFAENYKALLALHGNEKIQEVALFSEFVNLPIEEPKPQENGTITKEDKTNQIINAVKNSSISGKEVNIVSKEKQPTGGGNQGHSYNSSTDWSDVEETKKNIGLAAEQKVYDYLCAEHKTENVSWVSTYAERAKVLPKGQGNDNLHYDIAYFDNGIKRFVEVKGSASSSDIQIKMTKPEYDFGNNPENIDKYDIHYVILDKDTFEVKDYFIVKEFFKPNKDGSKKYNLIQDSFTLLAKIEGK